MKMNHSRKTQSPDFVLHPNSCKHIYSVTHAAMELDFDSVGTFAFIYVFHRHFC